MLGEWSKGDVARAKKDIPGYWYDPAQGKCVHGVSLKEPCKKCCEENKDYKPEER